jgi:hypothetical protein
VTNLSFTPEQFDRLRTLLDTPARGQPDANAILTKLEEAVRIRKVADRTLDTTLSLSSSRHRRGKSPLVADAERRALEAMLKR